VPEELAIHLGESMAEIDRLDLKMSPRDERIYRQGAAELFETVIPRVRFWLRVQGVELGDGEFEDIAARQYNASMHAAAKRIGAA
jgi:hypothetical protein